MAIYSLINIASLLNFFRFETANVEEKNDERRSKI